MYILQGRSGGSGDACEMRDRPHTAAQCGTSVTPSSGALPNEISPSCLAGIYPGWPGVHDAIWRANWRMEETEDEPVNYGQGTAFLITRPLLDSNSQVPPTMTLSSTFLLSFEDRDCPNTILPPPYSLRLLKMSNTTAIPSTMNSFPAHHHSHHRGGERPRNTTVPLSVLSGIPALVHHALATTRVADPQIP